MRVHRGHFKALHGPGTVLLSVAVEFDHSGFIGSRGECQSSVRVQPWRPFRCDHYY